jgi:phenylacetic acid degradation operon negative regulatory protein
MVSTNGSDLRLASFRRVVTDAPVSYSLYSAFSFYGQRCGGELPGPWIVRALESLGHERAAIRQTLYRMEASEELTSRTTGRSKLYRLTPAALGEAQAGLAKIMDDDRGDWDGQWTIVQFSAPSDERVERERLRELLRAEGFAALGPGLYIHPRDRSQRVIAAAQGHHVGEMIEVFRARRVNADDPRTLVARCWDLDALAAAYERFIERYEPVSRMRRALPTRTAFVLRFAVVFDFLEVAWRDPNLVDSLLPTQWAGRRAREIAQSLYQRFLPGAIAFGDSLR